VTAALDNPGVRLTADGLIALRPLAAQIAGDPALARLPGGFVTRRKGHGQEVADVRLYAEGDDVRHLDRGTTARTGALHVRQFQEERDRETLLVADFRPSMLWGISRCFRSVAAAEILALIGWRVVAEGGRVGLLAITAGAPVLVRARGKTRGMLDAIGGMVRAHANVLAMAANGQRTEPDLADALVRAERIAGRGGEIVLASGFDAAGAGLADRLALLSRRRAPRLIVVEDADGGRLPRGRYPIRLADGRLARVSLTGGPAAPAAAEIAGWPAVRLDAGAPLTSTARALAAAFPADRWP